jgi:hypothetical protein
MIATLDVRSAGALEIVRSGQLVSRVKFPNGSELVPSQAVEGAFYVTSQDSCTCPDARYRNLVCKHQLAIRLQDVLDAANPEEELAF